MNQGCDVSNTYVKIKGEKYAIYRIIQSIRGERQGDRGRGKTAPVLRGEKFVVRKHDGGGLSYLFKELGEDERVIVCGGDGTLNRFASDAKEIRPRIRIQHRALLSRPLDAPGRRCIAHET